MKVFELRKWLCGIVMMIALVFIACRVSFATNENTSDVPAAAQVGGQNLTSSNQGNAGIIRYRIPSKARKGLRELDKEANIHTPSGPVQVFAAFTSDTIANVTVGDVTIVPVVGDASAYLYVAFRVTSAMKVDIEWYLDDSAIPVHTEIGFEDPDVGGDLSKDYWYFSWFNPSSIATNGLHSAKIRVRKSSSGSWFEDSCRFLVLNYLD